LKVSETWRTAWKQVGFRWQFLWSALSLLISLVLIRILLDYLEGRSGVVITDPVLSLFPPLDIHWMIWTLVYSGILLGIVSVALRPLTLLVSLRALFAIVLLRVVSMLIIPLDPPAGSIPLTDPIVHLPFTDGVLTRDLFFSWQVAVLSLFMFVVHGRDLKLVFGFLTGLTSVGLLVQHAQYTISIVAAPCFAYAALGLARYMTLGGRSWEGPGRNPVGSIQDVPSPRNGNAEKRLTALSTPELFPRDPG
jgi:hypothetical protein